MPGVSRTRKWTVYVLFLCLIGIVAYALFYASDPQPTSSEKLKPIANELKPLIAQLEEYHETHGQYPSSLTTIGLPETVDVFGSPTRIEYNANFELNQLDPKTGRYVTSTGLMLGLHIDSANVLLYEHTAKINGFRLLTGNSISADTLDL